MGRKKGVVGYTTGVYDMFHIGHLRLLQRARQRCDYLIVGVSSDELVLEYKNKRPVIPFGDRREIVAALRCVDEVVTQQHRNKIAAYHEIKYDVTFVGDDWKGTPLWDELELELARHSAKVVYLPYTKDVSSTKFTEVLESIQSNTEGL